MDAQFPEVGHRMGLWISSATYSNLNLPHKSKVLWAGGGLSLLSSLHRAPEQKP